MTSRLMLGCGTVGQLLADRAATTGGKFHVLTDDAGRIDTLRASTARVTEGDPTDPTQIERATPNADVVFVADDDPERNESIAAAARTAFPDARIIAYSGQDVTESELETIRAHANGVIEPNSGVANRVLEFVTGPEAERAHKLRSTLREVDGKLAVIAHDNPDPDAIGSAIALAKLARHVGVEAEPCYYGKIAHQENQALVNLLGIELRQLDEDDSEQLGEYTGFALVDHSRPGVNDQLPENVAIDVVIDHHPPRGPVDGRFVDIRGGVGSTCTLLAEYFFQFDAELDETVATALLYGIRIDTADFEREVSTLDFQVASTLIDAADTGLLERVESPTISGDTFDTIARAIRNRERKGSILTTYVGEISNRDSLAQAADQLLDMQAVSTTVVFGRVDDTVFASARARGTEIDLGETLRLAFNQIGSAGGHTDMAGAQIPIGMLSEVDETSDETPETAIEEAIRERFFEALRKRPFALSDEHVSALTEFEFPLRSADPQSEDR